LSQGWRGLKDPELWPLVQMEAIYFITADKGFGDIRLYPPGTHAGILVLRPNRQSLTEFRLLVELVLSKYSLDTLVGTVAVVTPRGVRIRRKST